MVQTDHNNFSCKVTRVVGSAQSEERDYLAIEEPLEVRLRWKNDGSWQETTIAITMRTPGDDRDLAVGFLIGEGIIRSAADIYADQQQSQTGAEAIENGSNRVTLTLANELKPDIGRLQRHFYTTSSCGICGKTSLNALAIAGAQNLESVVMQVSSETIYQLPVRLKQHQIIFESTGGLHAAAYYQPSNDEFVVREDVGRHNAVDKLVGWRAQSVGGLDQPCALVLSGRASFELVQKAIMARMPIVAAVGAPSSLAVKLAIGYGVTLLGFVRGERFNIYSHPKRIVL